MRNWLAESCKGPTSSMRIQIHNRTFKKYLSREGMIVSSPARGPTAGPQNESEGRVGKTLRVVQSISLISKVRKIKKL